jgi:anti-anti-sigma factor
MSLKLEASVRQRMGAAIIDLRGDIDGSAEQVLTGAYAQAARQDPIVILLDFEEVDYINSKGIALIVVLLRQATQAGRRLMACGLSDHYREILQITRLADYIAICKDQESALAELQPPDPGLASSSRWSRVEAL